MLADGALDVADDGAGRVVEELDTDLGDVTAGARAAQNLDNLGKLDRCGLLGKRRRRASSWVRKSVHGHVASRALLRPNGQRSRHGWSTQASTVAHRPPTNTRAARARRESRTGVREPMRSRASAAPCRRVRSPGDSRRKSSHIRAQHRPRSPLSPVHEHQQTRAYHGVDKQKDADGTAARSSLLRRISKKVPSLDRYFLTRHQRSPRGRLTGVRFAPWSRLRHTGRDVCAPSGGMR